MFLIPARWQNKSLMPGKHEKRASKLKSLWILPDRKKEAGGFWENYRLHTTLIAISVLLDNHSVLCNKHLFKNPFIENKNRMLAHNLRDDETLHSAPSEKAEILNRQFASVFTRENVHSVPHMGESPYHTAPVITVTEKGVLKLLNGLNPHRASGPDEISTRFLKTTATVIAPILTIIFQSSIDQGKVPDDWKWQQMSPRYIRKETKRKRPTTGQYLWHQYAVRSSSILSTAKSYATWRPKTY